MLDFPPEVYVGDTVTTSWTNTQTAKVTKEARLKQEMIFIQLEHAFLFSLTDLTACVSEEINYPLNKVYF